MIIITIRILQMGSVGLEAVSHFEEFYAQQLTQSCILDIIVCMALWSGHGVGVKI